MCPSYMCILLYVKLIWCSGIPQIYDQLEEGYLGICAFCYMLNLFGVVVFHRSMVAWRGKMCLEYMFILLYVKLIWCSGIPQIYGQLEEGGLGICAFCYMLNLFGVVVFHTSMVDWRGYICPKYICILLYVKLIWCSGIPQIYGQLEEGDLGIFAFCYM